MNASCRTQSRFSQRRMLLRMLACLPLTAFADGQPSRQWLKQLPEIPDVELIDSDNQKHRLADLLKQPVVIGFFFTHCSTVCPLQTATFKKLQKALAGKKNAALMLSISLDPINDTPAAMRQYAEKFRVELGLPNNWLMLTGNKIAMEPVWKAFANDNGPPEAHSSSLWVGSLSHRRWTRLDGFVSTDDLSDWLEASTA